jgi:hypothetical protein
MGADRTVIDLEDMLRAVARALTGEGTAVPSVTTNTRQFKKTKPAHEGGTPPGVSCALKCEGKARPKPMFDFHRKSVAQGTWRTAVPNLDPY